MAPTYSNGQEMVSVFFAIKMMIQEGRMTTELQLLDGIWSGRVVDKVILLYPELVPTPTIVIRWLSEDDFFIGKFLAFCNQRVFKRGWRNLSSCIVAVVYHFGLGLF